MRALVTGAAGMVGSSMCKKLLDRGVKVFGVDNFSLGTPRHLEEFSSHKDFRFERWDVSKRDWHQKLLGEKFETLIHLAANSDISIGREKPWMDHERTFLTTFESLLAAREMKIPHFVFSSSSAVYGENPVFPTPEDNPKLHPISVYGAGKLSSEAYISGFVENYGISAWVYRFGNVVGKRMTHGVIYDFIHRLRKNPSELTVLGNGHQTKTYIDVEDCVDGMLLAYDKSPEGKGRTSHEKRFQIFNLSTDGTTSVREIAEKTCEVVTQGKTKILYGTSPVGWVGDVPKTSLSIEKMTELGWAPKLDSKNAVWEAIRSFYEWSKENAKK